MRPLQYQFFVRVDYNVSAVVTVISPGFSVDYRFADLVLVKNGTFLPDPGLHKMPFFATTKKRFIRPFLVVGARIAKVHHV